MKKIAVEEHFLTKESLDLMRQVMTGKYHDKAAVASDKYIDIENQWDPTSKLGLDKQGVIAGKLLDVGKGRLAIMDEAKVDMQVLSHVSPGIQVLDAAAGTIIAKKCNDILAGIIKKYPKRFAGLATLAPQDPKAAAAELKRAVNTLGMCGAVINSHTKGGYLDEKKFWVILETAESLNVPIYIHPRSPSADMIKPYMTYPGLASAMLGFSHEASLHAMRLMCSGAFDAFPKLKIILGHLGESLPFWQWRLDNHWVRQPIAKKLKKVPSQYLRDNFFVTTSGMFSHTALLNTYMSLGADNIMFAVDHPFENSAVATNFIDTAPICEGDKEKICWRNAKKLFKL
jgi:5-carboxyvanillate decarboxylase